MIVIIDANIIIILSSIVSIIIISMIIIIYMVHMSMDPNISLAKLV